MKWKDVLKALQGLGLSPRALVILAIVVPLAVVAVVYLYKYYQERKAKKAEPPAVAGEAAAPVEQVDSARLRKVWKDFLGKLPASYRRSILNFEHFVVFGAASSGKSRIIDTYTDWRRQTKALEGTPAQDADLQLYLASGAVIMEVSSRVLEGHSKQGLAAVHKLWRPIFALRAPTVVVVVDAIRLRESTPDVVRDLAETLRAKINFLSSIRRRPIEVRVVVSHLDEIEGFGEFARFCSAEGISTRVPFIRVKKPTNGLAPAAVQPNPRTEIEAWIEQARGHLARALTSLGSGDLRRVIAFLRRVPELVPTLGQFVEALFAHEPMSEDPIPGGIFLASDPPGTPNPLRYAMEAGPGPDPRRTHLIAAALLASACVTYMGFAYVEQQALWSPASEAFEKYTITPETVGTDRERALRETVCEFTYHNTGGLYRFPGFFADARQEMRARLSDRMRDDLLIPGLRNAALVGVAENAGMSLKWRRSLYYLGLIHSDRDDRLEILDEDRLKIWTAMTGLQGEVITDYLKNTDVAYRRQVSFELGYQHMDERDTAAYWIKLLREIENAMADGILRLDELATLKRQATEMEHGLSRFDHDEITKKILEDLDRAADSEDAPDTAIPLQLTHGYTPLFEDHIQNVTSADVQKQVDQLRIVLRTVMNTTMDVTETRSISALIERLAQLYDPATIAPASAEPVVSVTLAGELHKFDKTRWAELIRDSRASLYMASFMQHGTGQSIFFDAATAADLRPVMWNPYGGEGSIFVGRGVLDGSYTKAAYDKHVRAVVVKLTEELGKTRVPEAQKQQLTGFVKDHVRLYASEYRSQLLRFYRSFGLNAPSTESLRVALAQMSGNASPFNDFLTAVDANASVDTADPILDPMKEALADFENFHNVVNPAAGSPELGNYKAILGQLLADLGGAAATGGEGEAAPAGADAGAAADSDNLEKALSPVGKLALANLRGEKGSYASQAYAWLANVKLAAFQHAPFLSPFRQLSGIGHRDIERVVSRVWEKDMMPDVRRLAEKFPFNRGATEEVSPQELTELIHPQDGRFFQTFSRYLEPLSTYEDGGPFRERSAVRGAVALPSSMYPVVNALAALSARLWDSKGKPQPIPVRVATVPFERAGDAKTVPTLVYLNAASKSIFNFNQKPGVTTVQLDWTQQTKDYPAQVGVKLTEIETKEDTYPEPIVAEGSFWSFWHLVQKAEVSAVKHPPDAQLLTWTIAAGNDAQDKTRARFAVVGDPWKTFSLGDRVRSEAVR